LIPRLVISVSTRAQHFPGYIAQEFVATGHRVAQLEVGGQVIGASRKAGGQVEVLVAVQRVRLHRLGYTDGWR
jgi:hypothetical protein